MITGLLLLGAFFPTCQARVVRFLDVMTSSFLPSFFLLLAGHHLPARDCSETRRTSSAASLDCTCQFLIAVGLAGLLQCDSFCGPRRAFTARKSLWASPDFLRLEIAVGFAGLFAPRKNAERMSDKNVRSGCQKKCQRECQMECQIKCQR